MKNWKDYGRAIIMFDEALGKFKESNYDKELALDTYNKVLAVLNHEFLMTSLNCRNQNLWMSFTYYLRNLWTIIMEELVKKFCLSLCDLNKHQEVKINWPLFLLGIQINNSIIII